MSRVQQASKSVVLCWKWRPPFTGAWRAFAVRDIKRAKNMLNARAHQTTRCERAAGASIAGLLRVMPREAAQLLILLRRWRQWSHLSAHATPHDACSGPHSNSEDEDHQAGRRSERSGRRPRNRGRSRRMTWGSTNQFPRSAPNKSRGTSKWPGG